MPIKVPKFNLGEVFMTSPLNSFIKEKNIGASEVSNLISRHLTGDWGIIEQDSIDLNNEAIETKDRIMSAYMLEGRKIWIITDPGHEVTTLLFPEDY